VQAWLGWRANFIIIVVIGVATIVFTWRLLPETLHARRAVPITLMNILRSYGGFASNRIFLANLGIVALSYAGLFAWISDSPFVLQDLYGLSPLEFSVAFAAACLGSLISGAIGASLVMRIGMDRTIGLGTLGLAAGGLSMIAACAFELPPVTTFVLSMALYQAGLMFAMPQAIACAMMPFADRAGSASSLLGFVQQSSAALLGVLIGYNSGRSAWLLAATLAATGCLSLILWVSSRNSRGGEIRIAKVNQVAVQVRTIADGVGQHGAHPCIRSIAALPSA